MKNGFKKMFNYLVGWMMGEGSGEKIGGELKRSGLEGVVEKKKKGNTRVRGKRIHIERRRWLSEKKENMIERLRKRSGRYFIRGKVKNVLK